MIWNNTPACILIVWLCLLSSHMTIFNTQSCLWMITWWRVFFVASRRYEILRRLVIVLTDKFTAACTFRVAVPQLKYCPESNTDIKVIIYVYGIARSLERIILDANLQVDQSPIALTIKYAYLRKGHPQKEGMGFSQRGPRGKSSCQPCLRTQVICTVDRTAVLYFQHSIV